MIELLATAAATFAAATGGPVDPRGPANADQPGWHDRRIGWALAGVDRDERSLVVQPGWWGGCDQGPPEVRVAETATGISIETVVREPDGIESMICPAIARTSPPVRVELTAPVEGRRVTGPQRSTAPGAALPPSPVAERRVPRVTGLAAADARRVLCGWLVRARGATGERVVRWQGMRPGAVLDPAAVPTPERCGELPARPFVRLRAGA